MPRHCSAPTVVLGIGASLAACVVAGAVIATAAFNHLTRRVLP